MKQKRFDVVTDRMIPQGKWLNAEQNINEWYCSECKGIHNDPEAGKWRETVDYKYAFCPLCGADMRGTEE